MRSPQARIAFFLRRIADALDPRPSLNSAAGLRKNLLERAEAYSRDTGISLSEIGKRAVSDDRFVHRIKSGSNFTIETYQRFIDWIDAQEEKGVAA